MRQSEQSKDRAGGYDIGFHRNHAQSLILACKLGNDNGQDNENRQYYTCHEEEPRMSAEEPAQECLQLGVG
jgi:hypothetical protein